MQAVIFRLPSGQIVPEHFHVTEVGVLDKKFIDCGATIRSEKAINFQLWHSDDFDHRLAAQKLLEIIALSESKLDIGDHEIEVEYQGETIGKYGLEFENDAFILKATLTDCLAPDKCVVPVEKKKVSLQSLGTSEGTCSPDSGCC